MGPILALKFFLLGQCRNERVEEHQTEYTLNIKIFVLDYGSTAWAGCEFKDTRHGISYFGVSRWRFGYYFYITDSHFLLADNQKPPKIPFRPKNHPTFLDSYIYK